MVHHTTMSAVESLAAGSGNENVACPATHSIPRMTESTPQLVFVPGLGFRSQDANLLREPVTERIDDWEVTVDSG